MSRLTAPLPKKCRPSSSISPRHRNAGESVTVPHRHDLFLPLPAAEDACLSVFMA